MRVCSRSCALVCECDNTDVNECASNSGGCDVRAKCINTPGSAVVSCCSHQRACADSSAYGVCGVLCLSAGAYVCTPFILSGNLTGGDGGSPGRQTVAHTNG